MVGRRREGWWDLKRVRQRFHMVVLNTNKVGHMYPPTPKLHIYKRIQSSSELHGAI